MTSRELNHTPPAPAELRRLVNAVIWPGFVGTTVPAWLDGALREGLAGVVYFSHNIDPDAPAQVAALSAALRAANPDAVIGVDEEGGNVSRLQAREGSDIPGAAVLGALDEPTTTAAAGRAIGRLCRAAGVNLALAPVADVNTNPRNPVIGVRAFGSGTALVSAHTAAAVAGIQSVGVGACVKHFPGHGDTVADSHLEAARVDLTLAELTEHHLPPFQAAVDAGVAAVMTAHIIVPELGGAPATLNPRAAGLLRGLGFEGLLITDALDMAAVRATVGAGEGAVLALLAGADLLCVGNPLNAYTTGRDDEACYTEVFDAVAAAVQAGRLPVATLRGAGARVRAFARWSREAMAESDAGAGDAAIDWVGVAARACRIDLARGWFALPELAAAVTVVDARMGHNMAAGPTHDFLATALRERHRVTELPAGLDAADIFGAVLAADGSVLVIVDSVSSTRQRAIVAAVAAAAPEAVCINAGLAPRQDDSPALSTVHCHGFSRVTALAVVRRLHART